MPPNYLFLEGAYTLTEPCHVIASYIKVVYTLIDRVISLYLCLRVEQYYAIIVYRNIKVSR